LRRLFPSSLREKGADEIGRMRAILTPNPSPLGEERCAVGGTDE
jgi:hypothetical protein